MQTLQNDPSVKKEKAKGYSLAGLISIFLHIFIFILIGGTVIVEQVIPKHPMIGEVESTETVTETPPEETPEENPLDAPQSTEEPAAAVAPEASPVDMSTITMDSTSPSFTVPLLGNANAPDLIGTGDASTGAGLSGTPGRVAKKIDLFGAKTETAKLGVILDCSGSGQAFLVAALKEIDKNFESAPTILAMGCGMGRATDVKVELYGKLKPDREKDKIGSRTVLGQLAGAVITYKDLEKNLQLLKKRDNVWVIYGGDVHATQFGFDKLIDEGVDTIYWFSDLQDSVDVTVITKLTSELKRKGIKVIVHNFSGKQVPPLQETMATQTGGQAISKKP